jgi:heterodisulfide reductase subunit C
MKIIGDKEIKIDKAFAKELAQRSGENVFLCYQCRKCASGCPNRQFMESSPAQFMRYAQLGMTDEMMKQNTIWYCLSCHTCSARCPQDIDIAHVVDTVRIMVQEKKIKVDSGNTKLFNRLIMTMLKYTGRMYEVALTGLFNVFSLQLFKDIPLGMKLIKKGKLKILPSIKRPFEMMKMFSRAKKLKK